MAHRNILIAILIISLLILACLVATSCTGRNRHVQVPRTMGMGMEGVADTLVVPDRVVWTVKVYDLDPQLTTAKSANDAKLAAVMEALEQVDRTAGSLRTGAARIERQFRRCDDGVNRFSHFCVKRTVTFRQDQLASVDATLDKLVNSADVEVVYHYEVADPEAVMRELRKRALDQARVKIESIATYIGRTMGELLNVNVTEQRYRNIHHNQREIELTGVSGPEARFMESRVRVNYRLN